MPTIEEAVLEGRAFKATHAETVSGDELRNLFLGKMRDGSLLRGRTEGSGSSGSLMPAGIIIDGGASKLVTIVAGTKGREEAIDLSNLAAMDGAPLLSLALSNCIISAELLLTGSHFAFVSITNCEIVRIDGDHCRIDNHCRLTYLTAAPPGAGNPEVAQIRLVGARIDGTADLRGCQLQAPPSDRWPAALARGYADRFALSLASATINGRLLLDDGFTALGGVSLYQTTIGNSLSLRTARLESRDTRIPALDAEEMRLSGSLIWAKPRTGPSGAGEDWEVAGRVVLERAEIGGDCTFANCRWAGTGALSLAAGGDFVNHISGGIDARLCHIRGQLSLDAGCRLARWDAPPPRRTEENRIAGLFGPSLDAWKIRVEKGVRIENGTDFFGPILFNCSHIDHEFVFRGNIALPLPLAGVERIPEALDLSGSRIGGLVRILGEFSGGISMQRAAVDGGVELQGLKFSLPPLVPGNADADRKGGHASILDLSSATVTGTLHVGELELKWRQGRAQPLASLVGETTRPQVVGIGGKQIGKSFALEYFLSDGTRTTVIFTSSGPQLYDGGFSQFQSLGQPFSPIRTAAEAEQYLRVFFDGVIGELGPTRNLTIEEIEQDGQDWLMNGCEFISGGQWYKADLRICSNGTLLPSDDRQIAKTEPVPEEMWRIGPFELGNPVIPASSLPDTRCAPWFEAAVRHYFADRQLRPVIIDLRGLHCRAFGDDDALPWERLGCQRDWRLLLDGINFAQFDRTDPKERTKRDPPDKPARRRRVTSIGPAAAISSISLGKRRTNMLQSYEDRGKVRGWQGLTALAGSTEYSPQPFEIFARAYSQGGDHDVALAIVKAQKRLQWKRAQLESRRSISQRWQRIVGFVVLHSFVIVAASAAFLFPPMNFTEFLAWFALFLLLLLAGFLALAFMWPWIHLLIGKLFDESFGFGLKPRRAMVTFALCLIGGTIGTYGLESLKPIAQVPAKISIENSDDRRQETKLGTAIQGCNVVDDSAADRFLYAFDVFVPLIDVRQECAFSIDEKAGWVRALRTFYAALGWLVVTLSLLTFSGVLRRDVEH